MQACDSTCAWCARQFWTWWAGRARAQNRTDGRSGVGSFNAAAATSIRAGTDVAAMASSAP